MSTSARKTLCVLTAGIIATMLSVASSIHATTIIPSTLEYMTNFVDTIVLGTVQSQTSYWEDKKIFTDVVVEVQEVVKHSTATAPATVTLKILGGQVGDTKMEVDQAPVFHVGEKTMLFLKKEHDKYHPFGIFYGIFQIHFDQSLRKEVVDGPYFHYSTHVDLSTNQPIPARVELLTDNNKELDSFISRVKELLR